MRQIHNRGSIQILAYGLHPHSNLNLHRNISLVPVALFLGASMIITCRLSDGEREERRPLKEKRIPGRLALSGHHPRPRFIQGWNPGRPFSPARRWRSRRTRATGRNNCQARRHPGIFD